MREEYKKYNTDYQKMIIEKYADEVPTSDDDIEDYEKRGDFWWVLAGPEQYEVEEEMTKYIEEHPKATIKELLRYFEEVAPPGLPPCASEWDESEWD